MNLTNIKTQLQNKSIFLAEQNINGKPSITGYDKKFKWKWIATQLNTFVVAIDYGEETISVPEIEKSINESFNYAKENYTGWPRGLQSGLGVICILIGKNIDRDAIEYCKKLKSGKKWAGFTIPIIVNSETKECHYFNKNPMWGRIYYPYFKQLIIDVTG